MMYLALTYDHRLLDGREAVTFLVKIKVCYSRASFVFVLHLTGKSRNTSKTRERCCWHDLSESPAGSFHDMVIGMASNVQNK
jgi:hypothetical protein